MTEALGRLRDVAGQTVARLARTADYAQVFAESTLLVSVESVGGAPAATCTDLREGVGCMILRDGRWRYTSAGAAGDDAWPQVPDVTAFTPTEAGRWAAAGDASIRAVEDFTHRRYAVADTRGAAYAGAAHTLRRRVEATVTSGGRRFRGLARQLRKGPPGIGLTGSVDALLSTAVANARDSAAASMPGRHRTPVVFGPSAAAGFLHELVGHALEADNFALDSDYVTGLRRPGALPAALTVLDDPSVENGFGSYPADDEGCPAAATTLLANGEIGTALTSVRTTWRSGGPRTANARRADFRRPALPRASNIVVRPGPGDARALLEAGPGGVLHVGCLGAGMIQIHTGEYSFAALNCHYRTPAGDDLPVRDVSLVGSAVATLARLEAIGSDFGGDNVTCGKQGQMVGIGLYSPSMRYADLEWSAA